MYNFQVDWTFRYKFLCVLRPCTYINFSDLLRFIKNVFFNKYLSDLTSFTKCYIFFLALFILKFMEAISQEEKYETMRIILAIKLIFYLVYCSCLCMNYLCDITLPLHVNISCKVWVLCECKI